MSDAATTAPARAPTLTVRRLAPDVIQKLKDRAWGNRRSMESEIRQILTDAVMQPAAAEGGE